MKESYILKLEGKKWTDCIDKAFEDKKADIKMDGFRKGQVPKEVYIKKYGVESLFMDAIDIAVDRLFVELMKDPKTITPVVTPEIEIKDINREHVEVEFKLLSAPSVKLGKYKDLKVKKDKIEVTKEEIEHEVGHIKEQFADLKILDDKSKIKDGTIAIIDFEGFKDGVAFQGGKGDNYSLTIGSHTFIPGFEEALIGLKKGDKKDIDITFPENYHSEELKGQKVVFKVEVKELKERVLPEFDKAFFEDLGVGGVTSMSELEEYIRANKMAEKERSVQDKFVFDCLDAIVEDAEFTIPEEMTNDETNNLVKDFSSKLEMQGMKIEDYLKYCNSDMDKFKDSLKDEANKRIGYRLVVDEVIKKEKLEVTKEEIKNELDKVTKQYNMSKEDFLKEVGSEDTFKYELLMRKATELITGEKKEK